MDLHFLVIMPEKAIFERYMLYIYVSNIYVSNLTLHLYKTSIVATSASIIYEKFHIQLIKHFNSLVSIMQ